MLSLNDIIFSVVRDFKESIDLLGLMLPGSCNEKDKKLILRKLDNLEKNIERYIFILSDIAISNKRTTALDMIYNAQRSLSNCIYNIKNHPFSNGCDCDFNELKNDIDILDAYSLIILASVQAKDN